ncbi:MarR family transcriptional regulator [Virgibacillus sp. AGTR]|uniref:MarR family winged helix-turn-helix transcriptional regulator n=1 Tax=unclassified Virgibacillus TaxID=2620237 RepID=UPI0003F7664C|nr:MULTISPECIES: MarR family transcriptional regulator [Bacillaceae]MCC2252430.1 MarR family transcriptional regulator [Virgibacillus sp. AGTR]MDY7044114.1 MarR family transcriptional regulator [Virgibacillus sp. M23]
MKELLNRDLLHLLNQRFRFFTKEMNNRLSDHGLFASQWSIIFCIDRFGPMTQTEIWKYLNIEAPTVTRTLSRLERSGWITRKQGTDKRERVIELTDYASNKIPIVRETMDQFDNDMVASLTYDEKVQLYTLLTKLATGENNL